MNEVFGIVLLLDALFITILYSRKDRVEKISKWGKRTVVFLIVVLVIIDGYFLIGDCDNFYVFSGKQAIQSYDDSLENDNQQTIFNNKILGNSTGKIVQKASDKLKGVFCSVILLVVVYFVYKADAIKRYKVSLKNELYEIRHLWMGEKTLADIMVDVNVTERDRMKKIDICEFFSTVVDKHQSGIYYILGQAGEGKTVSVRKICGNFLDNVSTKRIHTIQRRNKKRELIPVIMNCIDVRKINSESELVNKIINQITSKNGFIKKLMGFEKISKKLKKIIRSELKNGSVIIFFDGFDEIKEEERFDFFSFLNDFYEIYDKSYYIVTSRTAIFEESGYIELEKERILWLTELEKERILDFLEKWNFKEQNAKWILYEKIIGNYQLERLAGNPLLLTLICYLSEKTKLGIPKSITSFYEESIKCLLEDWEDTKKISKRIYTDSEIKQYLLEEIAYWQYSNEKNEFKYEEIKDIIKKVHIEYGEEIRKVLDEIYLYSGLLERAKPKYYKFYHRSFYEFFLAKYLLRNEEAMKEVSRKSTQNYNVLFFYYALSKDTLQREIYIKEHLNNPYVIEPLLLEISVSDIRIIQDYIDNKLKSLKNTDAEYQFLGNIVVKYPSLNKNVTKILLEKYKKCLRGENNQETYQLMQRIISALSYYEEDGTILKLIQESKNQIDMYLLTLNANIRLSKVFSKVFGGNIGEDEKRKMIKGFVDGNNYNCILQILKDNKKESNRKIIFQELLYATKKAYFIGWFKNQDLSNYVNPHIKKKVNEWTVEYGWKWGELTKKQLVNRYILVYYLMLTENDSIENNKISSRIKYVATYIKNKEKNTEEVTNYYIDLEEYDVKTISELSYHWKKASIYEKIRMNPKVGRNIQLCVSLIIGFILSMIFLYYKIEYKRRVLSWSPFGADALIKDTDQYKYYVALYTYLLDTKNLKISRYGFSEMPFWIFYFLWFYLQYKTYDCLLQKPYNLFYKYVYIMISMLYIGEYLYLIQNNLFRIGGLLLVAIVYIFAMNQHKYNMPSYREPLYSKIVEYLQNDDI